MHNLSSSQSNPLLVYRQAPDAEHRTHDSTFYHYAKRSLDIFIIIIALATLLPIVLIIALLIKLDSPGPVLFVQERMGSRRRKKGNVYVWESKPFRMYKFRSMYQDADQSLHIEHIKAYVAGSLDTNDDEGVHEVGTKRHHEVDAQRHPKFKLAHDDRITNVGQFIRKTSLDELPQLINVLLGEMSLVGPRPVPLYEAALYKPEHQARLLALPGLTGLWQVEGRGEVTFEEMMRLDLEYVRQRSIKLDLWILMRTIPAAFLGQGAS